jgi:hypothetical protein
MPTPPIDTSDFQLGVQPDDDDPDEGPRLASLEREARAYLVSRPTWPAVQAIKLAYGVGPIIGLFLVRFVEPLKGELEGETEQWLVVGDLPSVCFETDIAPTRALALKLYCAICEDWAETIIEGRDLSQCYPIRAAPTKEHAQMLLGRIEFIRDEIIPLV